jgi:hypothetical protein
MRFRHLAIAAHLSAFRRDLDVMTVLCAITYASANGPPRAPNRVQLVEERDR